MVALMLHGMAALIMLVSVPVSTASFEWVLLIESTEMWRLFSAYMIGDNSGQGDGCSYGAMYRYL